MIYSTPICPKCSTVNSRRPTGGENRYGCDCTDSPGRPPQLSLEEWTKRCARFTACKNCGELPFEGTVGGEHAFSHSCEWKDNFPLNWWQGSAEEWLERNQK